MQPQLVDMPFVYDTPRFTTATFLLPLIQNKLEVEKVASYIVVNWYLWADVPAVPIQSLQAPIKWTARLPDANTVFVFSHSTHSERFVMNWNTPHIVSIKLNLARIYNLMRTYRQNWKRISLLLRELEGLFLHRCFDALLSGSMLSLLESDWLPPLASPMITLWTTGV